MTAEQNKIQILLKLEDVPPEGNHCTEKVEWIKTKKGGRAIVLILVNKHGEQLKVFARSYLMRDGKEFMYKMLHQNT